MGAKRFVEWEEQFVSHDRGSRIVHYYLKDQSGHSVLAVEGTERSLRHMVYVVSQEFLDLPGLAKPSNSSFKWRSRREVVDWLTSLLSKGDYATKFKHEASRTSDTDLSNEEEVDELDSCVNNYKDKFSRKIRATSKGITWLGSSWTCRKRLRHYESFRRSGITISVNNYVYVMAEEKVHHIAYLEDMYEDKKAQKKVRVRWFHRTNEVNGPIPPPQAREAEVFITPFRQVLSVECVDGQATILTPEHYEKCLAKFPPQAMGQIHVCFRQFDNEGIKSFSLNEMQGYWHQRILKSIDLADLQDYSKQELSDSFDLDEDTASGRALHKYPRKNRCTRKRLGASDRVYGRKPGEKNKVKSGNIYRQVMDGGADRDLDKCISEKRYSSLGLSESRKIDSACEQQFKSFDIGEKIELLCQDSGIRGCWFRCTIIKKVPHRIKVLYKDVLNEDGSGNLQEWVPSCRIAIPDKLGMRLTGRPTIRPCPPENILGNFEVGTAVDAWWNDGWWEGVVVMDKELTDELHVFFPGENVSSIFKKCDLRPSREWADNQWIDLKKNADLATKLVLSDSRQGLDIVGLCSSLLSDNFSAYVYSGELQDLADLSDRKLCIISQVAARESRKLEMAQNAQKDEETTVTVDVKEELLSDYACGDHDNLVNASVCKNMDLHECFCNLDASRMLISSPKDSVDGTIKQGSPMNLESNKKEICCPPKTRLRGGLRWKSSRKRQRAGDSTLLSRSTTCCGEESKRIRKLVDKPDISNGREPLLESSEDMPERQEEIVDVKTLKKGHDNLKPTHGSSLSDTLFISSMPVANLVMSR
ncbi:hypothetical protein SUGI_0424850 [Cryptomeria japonica]|uniref:uncharacterized protein LOC131032181 n=1 Tax=Cryptomeria japonica TaxID=3369 RepID=UPI002408C104|nr:uncharacterized protein LOC131032181 [Cryptomeria japonica]GLJ22572.1 hypothetical protein SUGI_0424850 [Cryptomeria japonica]